MIIKSCETISVKLFMAGDHRHAKILINQWVSSNPMCFSISKVDYVYTFGCERGFMVEAINYPRFPSNETSLVMKMCELAKVLMVGLNQGSYTIQSPSATTFHSRRNGDE